jgi:Putative prokaryotic signal transducing protein
MKLVTIFRTFNQAEAQLVCSRLEAVEFHPFIANENSSAWLGGTSSATTLRIEVPEDEAADAKEFLETPTSPAE